LQDNKEEGEPEQIDSASKFQIPGKPLTIKSLREDLMGWSIETQNNG